MGNIKHIERIRCARVLNALTSFMNIQLKPSDPFDGWLRCSLLHFHSDADAHLDALLIVHSMCVFFCSWFQQDNKNVKEIQYAPVGRSFGRSLFVSRGSEWRVSDERESAYAISTVKVCTYYDIFFSHLSFHLFFLQSPAITCAQHASQN